MEKSSSSKLISFYNSPNKKNWSGRIPESGLRNQYWHQLIQTQDLNKYQFDNSKKNICLLGYACDEGVRRNLGRVGAVEAPEKIRQRLAKLPWHFDKNIRVTDIGDFRCKNKNMESTQQQLGDGVFQLLQKKTFPILLGGGHDIAFGHFLGIHKWMKTTHKKKLSIINFDAHFDLRKVYKAPNSGTPFYQICELLKKEKRDFDYTVIGIQKQSNTQELFDFAKKNKVNYYLSEDVVLKNSAYLKKELKKKIKDTEALYITIDIDCFSSIYAQGVSAPSPFGLDPMIVLDMLQFLVQTKKVVSLDFAEFNPKYDSHQLTEHLVARMIDKIIDFL